MRKLGKINDTFCNTIDSKLIMVHKRGEVLSLIHIFHYTQIKKETAWHGTVLRLCFWKLLKLSLQFMSKTILKLQGTTCDFPYMPTNQCFYKTNNISKTKRWILLKQNPKYFDISLNFFYGGERIFKIGTAVSEVILGNVTNFTAL